MATLLDVNLGDAPILPHEQRALQLPRSIIGTVNRGAQSDREQIDVSGQCVARIVVGSKTRRDDLGAKDICKTPTIDVQPTPRLSSQLQ